MSDGPLAGVGVLITRPREQADELAAAIASLGGNAVLFPTLEIAPKSQDEILSAASRLSTPDIVIFVSPNAVRHGSACFDGGSVAAVGPSTAAALETAGHRIDIVSPSGYDSEHLLAEPQLNDVAGKIVRIVRGQNGREMLADTLSERGATVEYLAVYDRVMPEHSTAAVQQLESGWRQGSIDIVTIMSVATLTNLLNILPESCRELLARTRLVTPATRVIIEAQKRFPGIPTTLARGPQTNDMVEAITAPGPEHSGQ